MLGHRLLLTTLALVAIGIAGVVALGGPSSAAAAGAPLRIRANLECLDGGGVEVTLRLRNITQDRTFRIDPDLHMELTHITSAGREGVGVIFLFPARGWDILPPDITRRFTDIRFGEGWESEPGVDLSGGRLELAVDVFLAGRRRPVTEHLYFNGCPEGLASRPTESKGSRDLTPDGSGLQDHLRDRHGVSD